MNHDVAKGYLSHPEIGKGWQDRLVVPFIRMLLSLTPDTLEEIEIQQIKEKFGQLRLYVSGPSWLLFITEALEDMSSRVCEDCGRVHGWKQATDAVFAYVTTADSDGWTRTLCQHCRPPRTQESS